VSIELWFWLALASATVAIGIIIIIVMEREKGKLPVEKPSEPSRVPKVDVVPQTSQKTVTDDVISEAKDTLRLLDLERDILSNAVRRLYEASAEGKITEAERDQLAQKYSLDLSKIKDGIERGESIVALNELEKVREELIKMFSQQFDEINMKIEDLRQKVGLVTQSSKATIISEAMKEPAHIEQLNVEVEPPKETEEEGKAEDLKQPSEKAVEAKKKTGKPRPSTESEANDAEKKVEQILADVEQVLKKLNKMEVEE